MNRRRADKRGAILDGALVRFARDGYTRASIDAIAAEAGVSTRTIYNHFADKAELFQAVIQESASQLAEAQIAVMDRHLGRIVELEADLVRFAREWVTPMPDFSDHAALVRQIRAEAAHIPSTAIEAWQSAGPLRVVGALAGYMRQWAGAGLVRIDDPARAANHFARLVAVGSSPPYGSGRRAAEEIEAIVTSGVRAFLYGYAC